MSMFRSPSDESSSGTSSEASAEEVVLSHGNEDENATTGLQSQTSSLTEQRSLIIASLLKVHYQQRAAEMLNTAHGVIMYDRDSPEVAAYAQKMFDQASQLFASTGLIDKDMLQPDFAPIMQRYLTGIDQLGVKALQSSSPGRGATQLGLPSGGLPLISKTQSRVSRYNSEFTEEEVIGRGGFGTVYRCINHIDAGHYAVKRISLDVHRLASNGKAAMRQELETVLQEIRTMAKLEHNNIVRYFGAWIEYVGAPPSPFTNESADTTSTERNLILRRTGTIQTESTDSEAGLDGIIFGEDSKSQPGSGPKEVEKEPLAFSALAGSLSYEEDFFTDGDGATTRAAGNAPLTGMILNVQMSLHEYNLATYLGPSDRWSGRRCFHLRPALCIFLGILTGVQYLHASGFVHRDLKPANIFMSESTVRRHGFEDARCITCPDSTVPRYLNVRVGDFGLVGHAAEDLAAGSPESMVGTELYRPPLANASNNAFRVDEKLDVFALGILLFELLWPFGTRSERAVMLDNLRKHARLPVDFADEIDLANGNEFGVGGAVEKCIRGMVEGDAGNRWDCRKVRRGVECVLGML